MGTTLVHTASASVATRVAAKISLAHPRQLSPFATLQLNHLRTVCSIHILFTKHAVDGRHGRHCDSCYCPICRHPTETEYRHKDSEKHICAPADHVRQRSGDGRSWADASE